MSLPEDVLHEILMRLKKEDVAALFRCASTCKLWSRLVAEARGPDHTPSFLSGFFVRKRIRVFCTDRSSMTSLVPTQGWVFKPHRRLLGSFFPETAAGGRLGRAVPLAARHGLLLARFPFSDVEIDTSIDRKRSIVHLVVCNLLAGTWDTLPPLWSRWVYYIENRWKGLCHHYRSRPFLKRQSSIFLDPARLLASVQSSSHLPPWHLVHPQHVLSQPRQVEHADRHRFQD
jgi:hypothetical protein